MQKNYLTQQFIPMPEGRGFLAEILVRKKVIKKKEKVYKSFSSFLLYNTYKVKKETFDLTIFLYFHIIKFKEIYLLFSSFLKKKNLEMERDFYGKNE